LDYEVLVEKLWELKAERDAEEEAEACKPAQPSKDMDSNKVPQKAQSGYADKTATSAPDTEDVQKLLDTIKQEREEREQLQKALETALAEQEAAKARASKAEERLQKSESERVKENECL
jgi:hypothetical protein